jgi:Mg2+/Co2+ transporter CorC
MNEVVVTVKSEHFPTWELKNHVDVHLSDLRMNPFIKSVTCLPVIPRSHDAVVADLISELEVLEYIVGHMSDLYDENEWLNDAVDIQSIIPMSLDDWLVKIIAKIQQLRSGHLQ